MDYDIFYNLDFRCSVMCFLDYNPFDPESFVKKLEDGELTDPNDVSLDISTVHDNEHLTDRQMKAILNIKDDELRNVYLKGEWTRLTGLVFPNFDIVDSLPSDYDKRYYAIDFGWSHPFVLLEVRQKGQDLFIHEHVHESEFDYEELTNRNIVNELSDCRGCADSADPRSIKALREMGLKIRAVKKPKIIESVRRVREFDLHITKQSRSTIKDFKTYKRQKDKNDEYIEEPLKLNDDAPDALRYAVTAFAGKSLVKLL
jgi:phage terminase large subunit